MSVQFGRWNFDEKPFPLETLARLNGIWSRYAPGQGNSYEGACVRLAHQSFETTDKCGAIAQPYVAVSGSVFLWDGRLDNSDDLAAALGHNLTPSANVATAAKPVLHREAADVAIVAASFEKSGTDCLRRCLGDWALSIWNPRERTLLLAKDFIGTRHLYYLIESEAITWCTVLEPLLAVAERPLTLNEEYLAGWLTSFPDVHVTPYEGIHSVPPGTYISITPSRVYACKYWELDPHQSIRYPNDSQYEEHFRAVFSQSVARRLRSSRPVLAELSGGMDSSSIVCMADHLSAGNPHNVSVHTVSYFNDAEPNWDERPYFTLIEKQRSETGLHIDFESSPNLPILSEAIRFQPTPDLAVARPEMQYFREYLMAQDCRVVLSGIGGDEFTGGVPTPHPELADLLARGQFLSLARQLRIWSLRKRQPCFFLLGEVLSTFLPTFLYRNPDKFPEPIWLAHSFRKRHQAILAGRRQRTQILGPRPGLQFNQAALDVLRRRLAAATLPSDPPFEWRFPYLDRDLVEFLSYIPREQLVRPGERRSLMRRAMRNIVPREILERSRKASISRGPLKAVADPSNTMFATANDMAVVALGIVDPEMFRETIRNAREGRELLLVPFLRTLLLEQWLRGLSTADLQLAKSTWNRNVGFLPATAAKGVCA